MKSFTSDGRRGPPTAARSTLQPSLARRAGAAAAGPSLGPGDPSLGPGGRRGREAPSRGPPASSARLTPRRRDSPGACGGSGGAHSEAARGLGRVPGTRPGAAGDTACEGDRGTRMDHTGTNPGPGVRGRAGARAAAAAGDLR